MDAAAPSAAGTAPRFEGDDHDRSPIRSPAAQRHPPPRAAAPCPLAPRRPGGRLRAALRGRLARPPRTDMIVQLAHMVTDGVVSGAPDVWRNVSVVVVVAGAVALAGVSRLWYREPQPLPGVREARVGFGLLPVMLTGALVGRAALIMWRV